MTDEIGTEEGLTLVELIIYVMLVGLILLITAMILANSITTQRDVTSVSQATNRGQAMGRTIERAMHNAVAFQVNASRTELRVRTSLPGDLACQAFQLTDGTARLSFSSGPLPDLATDWSDWQDAVIPYETEPYFSVDGQEVSYTFQIETDSAPVRIAGAASTRSTPTGVTAPCW